MDLNLAHACAGRLTAAMLSIAATAPAEPLYLSALLRPARRVAELERDDARDPESRLVAQATLEAVERTQSPWRFSQDEPTCSRLYAARSLMALVAGQGPAPGISLELDLRPILARYNGPLGGAWELEDDDETGAGHRIVRRGSGSDEIIARVPAVRNALFLLEAHDDVAALLTEVTRLRTLLDDVLRGDDTTSAG